MPTYFGVKHTHQCEQTLHSYQFQAICYVNSNFYVLSKGTNDLGQT